jgi:aspartate-semialdehyde dehydrogenase
MTYPILGIIGAMGIAGSDLVGFLENELKTKIELRLFDESQLDDVLCTFNGEELQVEEFTLSVLEGLDVALFVDQSLFRPVDHLEYLQGLELKVIDCTGSLGNFREAKLYLSSLLDENTNLGGDFFSIPAPGVSQFVTVISQSNLLPIIDKIVVNSLEPVSTAGQLAMDELWEQGIGIYNQQFIESEAFEHQIIFNCIPQVGTIDEQGVTSEEQRFLEQSKALLGLPDINISVTLIRAPVFYCISQSITIFLKEDVVLSTIVDSLKNSDYIDFYGDVGFYPMPINVITNMGVHVGRLRSSNPKEITLWSVSDNVYFGLGQNVIPLLHMLYPAT